MVTIIDVAITFKEENVTLFGENAAHLPRFYHICAYDTLLLVVTHLTFAVLRAHARLLPFTRTDNASTLRHAVAGQDRFVEAGYAAVVWMRQHFH